MNAIGPNYPLAIVKLSGMRLKLIYIFFSFLLITGCNSLSKWYYMPCGKGIHGYAVGYLDEDLRECSKKKARYKHWMYCDGKLNTRFPTSMRGMFLTIKGLPSVPTDSIQWLDGHIIVSRKKVIVEEYYYNEGHLLKEYHYGKRTGDTAFYFDYTKQFNGVPNSAYAVYFWKKPHGQVDRLEGYWAKFNDAWRFRTMEQIKKLMIDDFPHYRQQPADRFH